MHLSECKQKLNQFGKCCPTSLFQKSVKIRPGEEYVLRKININRSTNASLQDVSECHRAQTGIECYSRGPYGCLVQSITRREGAERKKKKRSYLILTARVFELLIYNPTDKRDFVWLHY